MKIILFILVACAIGRRIAGIKLASHMPIAIRGLDEDEDDNPDEEGSMSGPIVDEDDEEEQTPIESKITGSSFGSFEKSNLTKGLDLPEGYEDMLIAQQEEQAETQEENHEQGQDQEEQDEEGDEEEDINANLVDQNVFISEEAMNQNGFENQEMKNILEFIEFKISHVQQLMEECIQKQFTDDVMATVKSVKEYCVGLSFQILFEDYRDGMKAMKQSIMEILHIKFETLPKHFEDEIDFYFTILEQFIDKDLALPQSLKIAKKTVSYTVNSVHFDHLVKISKPEIATFDEIHKKIKDTRDKVAQMLEEEMVQQEEYVENLSEQSNVIKMNQEEEHVQAQEDDYGDDDEETPEEDQEEEDEPEEEEGDDNDDDDDDEDEADQELNMKTESGNEQDGSGPENDLEKKPNEEDDTYQASDEKESGENAEASEPTEGGDEGGASERKLRKSINSSKTGIARKQDSFVKTQLTSRPVFKSVKIMPKMRTQATAFQSPNLVIDSGINKKH